MSKRIKMSTTVNISEDDKLCPEERVFWQCQTIKLLADLLFRHIDDLTVWCRMMKVSRMFNQVGTRLTKVVKHLTTIDITFGNSRGLYMIWYSNGLLQAMESYTTSINGFKKLHGQSTYYHQNGQIWCENNFINGRKHGVCAEWYSNEVLWCLQEWKNGELM